jgi:hypothetical protein
MLKKILPVFFLMPLIALCQVNDDFSDGDFSQNPQWTGDIEKFVVENGILRLLDHEAGQACLSTPSTMINNTQWEFWIRLAFTPSTKNHPRIYLVSDKEDLHSPLNGYFLRIGKDGTDNKRIFFFRQDGETTEELLAGTTNLASASNNIIRIKVTRDDKGNWEIFADPSGNYYYKPEGSLTDNTHTTTAWFGIRCIYTVSNSTKFYFDDFYAGDIFSDVHPLEVVSVKTISRNSLEVMFSNAVEAVTAQDVSNYFADQGIGHPLVAAVDPTAAGKVCLFFEKEFLFNTTYEIAIEKVTDFYGNTLALTLMEFFLFKASRFDVVFNEIMADPTPPVGLPPWEYIELFNTTASALYLEGWVLQYGRNSRELPAVQIPASGFLLLVTPPAFEEMQDFGNVAAVAGLPVNAINNEGSTLLLFDNWQQLICFIDFDSSWYQNPAKADGGWSLEKIDPYNFCQGKQNWRASMSNTGGTPAQENSLLASNPDISSPELLRAGFIDPSTIILFFNEPMQENLLKVKQHYFLEDVSKPTFIRPWNPVPISVKPLLPDFSRVELVFEQPMSNHTIYEIKASKQLKDCAGNSLWRNSAMVALPLKANPTEMVINEILFNPLANGSRYAEIFNRTANKVFDLKNYIISSMDTITGFLNSIKPVCDESFLFFPGQYVVLTADPDAVKSQYMTPNPYGFIATAGFPSMTNTSGILVFATKAHEIIDLMIYHEDMHLPLLTSKKGVALERLNPLQPTLERSNWHSAAQNVGFGTPAWRNSQNTWYAVPHDHQVVVYPEVFSPDGDGFDDLLQISYSFDKPGMIANIRIMDQRGRLIRFLRKAELLGTQGIITWNGLTDDQQKAAVGVYIIHVEVYDTGGNVKTYRKTAALARRVN